MKYSLPENIASSQDIAALTRELHEYSVWLNRESLKRRLGKKSTGDKPELSPAARDLAHQWLGKYEPNSASIDALAASLDHHRQTAPSVTITVAAPLPQTLKAELVAWCRKHLEEGVIVNFQFNATILGGIVVRYGSRVFDWSFRRQILAERARFPEVLRNV